MKCDDQFSYTHTHTAEFESACGDFQLIKLIDLLLAVDNKFIFKLGKNKFD